MISMSMSNQDIINVQTLLSESLRELHKIQTRIRYERITQERVDQNRNSSRLDQETRMSQPNNFSCHLE